MQSVLALDIGNTRIKGLSFEEGRKKNRFHWKDWGAFADWTHEQKREWSVVAGSVGLKELSTEMLSDHIQFYQASTQWSVPVKLNYKTPESLGIDRLAAVVAAWEQFGEACLIFDIGTCMTIDFVDHEGVYHGGNIAPGWKMRLRAMHEMTSNLPFAEADPTISLIGVSTNSALQAGAFHGILLEIKAYVATLKQRTELINVILTGGDANEFAKKLKMEIFALPDLVFEGLYKMLHAKLS
jgi:type III pantothenate kinase